MRTLLLIACLACLTTAQNAVQPPQNWTPTTPYVHGCLEIVDGTTATAIRLTWDSYQGNYLGIPDPRLAPSTTVLVGWATVPTMTQTLYGLAIQPAGVAVATVPALDWRETPNQGTGLTYVQVDIPYVYAPFNPPILITVQALVLHHFGAPDCAYTTNPVTLWL